MNRPMSKNEELMFRETIFTSAKNNVCSFFLKRTHSLRPEHVNIHDSKDNTPLYYASLHGHGAVVRLLLLLGADVSSANELGNVALHAAFMGNSVEARRCWHFE